MKWPPGIVTLGLIATGVGIIILVGSLFKEDFAGPLATPPATAGLGMVGAGFAGTALGFALDAYRKLGRLATGEINQKVAMLYGYAKEIRYSTELDMLGWNYLEKRILSDVTAMKNLGNLDDMRADVESARDSVLYELSETGHDQTAIQMALDQVLTLDGKPA
jgi:hypothetical protein